MEKWVELKKAAPLKKRLFCEKWIKLAKLGQSCKNCSHFIKWVLFGEMGQTCKNGSHLKTGSHLEKWVTLENVSLAEMGHPCKNVFHLKKRVTLLQKVLTYRSWSRLKNAFILRLLMNHTCTNESQLQQIGHFLKWITFEKLGHNCKNGLHLKN